MNNVRAYGEKDKKRVQKISLVGSLDKEIDFEKAENKYSLLMYCDYYIEQEPENCFVAVNDEDEAIGYIICSENYYKYKRIFSELYLGPIAKISIKRYVEARVNILMNSRYKNCYPAHFHIDVVEGYQRMGFGSQLISALKAHLAKKNIAGMMMVCGADNQKAINFYSKNGFKNLMTSKYGHAMGFKLNV